MPQRPVSFRPISDDDLPLLSRLYASTREDELAVVDWWTDEQKAEFLRQQFDAQHRFYQEQFSKATFDLIVVGGEPVGRLYVDRRDDEIRLIDIALFPEMRGQGVGGRILADLLDEARMNSVLVRIHVEHNNPAMRLYERLGFEKIEEQGVYWLMEWSPEVPATLSEPISD